MGQDRQRRISAVLDTNVLLGAKRRQLLILAGLGAYKLVSSQYILDEVQRVMVELGWGRAAAEAQIQALLLVAELVDERMITGGNFDLWLRDIDDHPIMATALSGKVDYLVTQNTRDFPPKLRFAGITIVTQDAFLHLLESTA
jgi:predicted nucleic acid-binding protein